MNGYIINSENFNCKIDDTVLNSINAQTFNIKDFIDNYRSDKDKERDSRRVDTNEVFTPFELIENMCQKISDADWTNKEKTFLEPSFGTGNIILYIIWNRICHGVSWQDALSTIYGTELMLDNVQEAKARIFELLCRLEVITRDDKNKVLKILDSHLVCTDFFDWDFENWKPLKQKETTAVSLF